MTFRRDLATLFPSRTPPRVAHHRIKAYQEAVTALGTAKAVRDKAYIPGTLDIFRVSDNHKYVKATDFEEIAPGGYRNLTIAANTQVKIEYLLDIDNMNLPVVAQEEAPTTPTAPTAPAASPPPQSLNFATDPAPLTPGSNVYWAGVFVPLTPDLQVVGMVIRNTTTGASYTMRIRPSNENAINTPGTVIASKDFTGNGGPMRVLFDTPVPLAVGTVYELAYSSTAAANVRYADSHHGSHNEDFALFPAAWSTAQDGGNNTNRSSGSGNMPNAKMLYKEVY